MFAKQKRSFYAWWINKDFYYSFWIIHDNKSQKYCILCKNKYEKKRLIVVVVFFCVHVNVRFKRRSSVACILAAVPIYNIHWVYHINDLMASRWIELIFGGKKETNSIRMIAAENSAYSARIYLIILLIRRLSVPIK